MAYKTPTIKTGIDAIYQKPKPAMSVQPGPTIQTAATLPPVAPKITAATSVKPAMGTPAPKPSIPTPPAPPVAPSTAYGGVPDANDPAMVGGRAMLDQRNANVDAEWKAGLPEATPHPLSPKVDAKEAQLKALQQSYLGTLTPAEEETAASKTLSDVAAKTASEEAKARSAYAQRVGAINEQATLQPFLTGRQRMASGELADQLAALESSSKAQTLPLSAQLAQLQAERTARSTRAEKELGFATPQTKDYKTVGEGQSIIDPITGEVVYQGAPKTENLPATVQEYEYAKKQGYTGSFSDYQNDDANRKRVAAGGSQDMNRLLTPAELQLYNMPAGTTFSDVLGLTPEKNLSGEAAKVYSIATTIKPEIEQLKTLLTGAGRIKLAQILSGLDPAASRLIDQVADKVGRLRSGGAINKDEAERFKAQILRAGDIMTGDTASAIAALDAIASEADTVAAGVNRQAQGTSADATPEESGFYQGADGLYYPKAKGGSAAAGNPAEAKKVASAIGQFESGGNYKALGPVLNSGMYKGDRAYGKYQVMGKNVPSWTKEALGVSMTPQQFLADPKAQDKVAEYRMAKLIDQGYGVEDIASIWFSGRPLAKAGNAKDQLGTSVPQYAKNVRAIYNRG